MLLGAMAILGYLFVPFVAEGLSQVARLAAPQKAA